MSEHFVIHHVGGRSGTINFPVQEPFEEDIINIIYDADEKCIQQIKDLWGSKKCNTKVLNYCLSKTENKIPFYINKDPNTSSFLKFNQIYKNYYDISNFNNEKIDYIFGDSISNMREVQLQTFSLRKLIKQKKVPIPDFISLDTQGSEMMILEGLGDHLSSDTLSVFLEVEFKQIYENQPLFEDIILFLKKFDFELSFLEVFNSNQNRGKIGIRTRGIPMYGEALFTKIPSKVAGNSKDRNLKLNKLCFISAMYQNLENIEICMSEKDFYPINNSSKQYLQFIHDLTQAIKKSENRKNRTFSEVWTCETSQSRFETKKDTKLKKFFKKTLILKNIFHILRAMKVTLFNLFKLLREIINEFKVKFLVFFRYKLTPVEMVLVKYKMNKTFKLILENRIRENINK